MARSLVAVGRFNRHTMEVVYYRGDPNWTPQPRPGDDEVDHDEKRKQALESADPEDF